MSSRFPEMGGKDGGVEVCHVQALSKKEREGRGQSRCCFDVQNELDPRTMETPITIASEGPIVSEVIPKARKCVGDGFPN
jgi:hypothetical protein